MKTKMIIAACMFAILAVFTITNVNTVYSKGSDPKCAECTKTSCDKSCSMVCTEKEKENCSMNSQNTGTDPGTPGKTSASEVKTEVKENSCSNCTKTSCTYMNSATEKSSK